MGALDDDDEAPRAGTAAPLIVTAELPAVFQTRVDALRRAHYPAERNHLAAHVTLFHALPPFVESEARGLLAALAAEAAPPEALLAAVMDLGTGTALRIESAAMLDLRDLIAERFHGLLTRQDQHAPRLHVTVQNKVLRAEAKALQAALASAFQPESFAFAGLALHRYKGGPWESVGRWSFRGRFRR
ncbi:MAG: 2'-5' RNA ligase family protein [Novosphingobium sp.]